MDVVVLGDHGKTTGPPSSDKRNCEPPQCRDLPRGSLVFSFTVESKSPLSCFAVQWLSPCDPSLLLVKLFPRRPGGESDTRHGPTE